MKLNGGDVLVESGVGFSRETPLPLVRMTVTPAEDGPQVTLHMTPGKARSIAADLFMAGSSAWAEAAIRSYAKEHGVDGDSIIGWMKTMTDADLKESE